MIAGTGNMAESIEYNRAILPVLAAKIPSKLGVRRDTFSAPPELWSSTNQPEIFEFIPLVFGLANLTNNMLINFQVRLVCVKQTRY
jgi:hypothetical protein